MGEIRVKSENLVESFRNTEYTGQYRICLLGKLDIKPSTSYTISFIMEEGAKAYFNEYIFPFISFTGTGQRQVLNITTIANIDKNISTWVDEYGWILCKNMVNNENPCNFREVMIVEGTYTSETIPPYQPYFLTFPAHEKTSTGWKDIPTHTMTATGWQGELTSQSPLEFRATGQSLLDWRIDGRASENLFDLNRLPSNTWTTDTQYYMNGGIATSKVVDPAAVTISVNNNTLSVTTVGGNGAGFLVEVKPSTEYRLAFAKSESLASDKTSCTYAFVDTSETIGQLQAIYGNDDGVVFTTDSNTKYVYFVFRKAAGAISYSNIMLNEGNTALPYEPYGGVGDWGETEQKYVIPVNVRSGNLYSGAWEQGYWAYSDGAAWDGDSKYVRTAKMLCKGNTKYEFVCSLLDGSKDYGFVFWDANGNFIGDAHSSDVQNTPVKYSAASPANARMMAVNIARYSDGERRPADILSFDLYELHEINLYTTAQLMDGDSLDYTTDQTAIPITQGDNTLTVETAVQPSKVYVKFEG